MKRALYVLLAAGLAFGLAGCNQSGGGYWPANPVAPTGVQQPAPLGGGNAAIVQNAFGASAAGISTSGGVAYANSALSGCAAIADFFNLPGSITSAFAAPTANVKASIMAASRSKSKAAELGMSLSAVSGSEYTKFTHTTTGTDYSGMTYEAVFTYYVKFLNSTGTKLTLDTSSSTDFWSFTGSSFSDVDSVVFYGDWAVTSKKSSSSVSCSVQSSGTSSSVTTPSEFKMSGTIGTSDAPAFLGGLKTTTNYAGVKSTFTYTGVVDGQSFTYSLVNTLAGAGSYLTASNLFYWGNSTSNYYGMGTQTIVANDGSKIEIVYEGTKYSIYVNGTLVYPVSSGSSSSDCCQ
jgi:predicted small lipoprotein YifL